MGLQRRALKGGMHTSGNLSGPLVKRSICWRQALILDPLPLPGYMRIAALWHFSLVYGAIFAAVVVLTCTTIFYREHDFLFLPGVPATTLAVVAVGMEVVLSRWGDGGGAAAAA